MGKTTENIGKLVQKKIDDDHIQTIGTGHKYYKSHVRPTKKYQDKNNPKIRTTIK